MIRLFTGIVSVPGTSNAAFYVDDFVVDGSSIALRELPTTQRIDVNGDRNTVYAGQHNWMIAGSGDGNTFIGSKDSRFIQWLFNGDGNTFHGAGGVDIYDIRCGAHAFAAPTRISAGAGNDRVTLVGNGAFADAGTGLDRLDIGGNGNTINGGDGNDTITVRGSQARVSAGNGNDQIGLWASWSFLEAGEGEDQITVAGNGNQVDAGAGNDAIDVRGSQHLVLGGAGDDKLAVAHMRHQALISTGITLDGGAGNDALIGNYLAADHLRGGDGHDNIKGLGGDDLICGGAGDDVLDGGGGIDTLSFAGARAKIVINLAQKFASGEGKDSVKSLENVVGSPFGDIITGNKQANRLEGGAGRDILRGREGADMLTGGADRDTFVFTKKDVADLTVDHITDFSRADRLDLHDILKGLDPEALRSALHADQGAEGVTIAAKIRGHFVDIVVLDGVHHSSISNLLAQGLIVA